MHRLILLSILSLGILISSFSFAQEETVKLQSTGIFKKNEKGVLIFTDDADKKKYYGFNKGVHEKVGDLVGKKVDLNARVKKKEGAKITLLIYIVSINSIEPEIASKAMVRGVAKAFASKDYEEFKKFTCLSMGKGEFKQFMAKNDDRKIVRTWDPVRDGFQEELIEEMKNAFAEISQLSDENGFDWNKAKILVCKQDDDIKAFLQSGRVMLYLHLDDCFITHKGLLTFDAPRAKVR